MNEFTFAHLADCHLGAFREEHLRELNLRAFERAMDVCIERRVSFIVISGDLFHRASPDLNVINPAVRRMKEASERGVRIYLIYGSHDHNVNTTSLIDVLGNTGLFKKIFMVDDEDNLGTTIDAETGAELAGVPGRTQALEREYYEQLKIKRKSDGFGIFMFHTAISELRPTYAPEEQSMPVSSLPEGFDYYAGGHVHERIEDRTRNIFFPGPLFGASFRDLKSTGGGGFYIVEVKGKEMDAEFLPLRMADLMDVDVNLEGMDSKRGAETLYERCSGDFDGKTVLLDLHGTLSSGSVTDIDVKGARSLLESNGAELVVVNSSVTTAEKMRLKSEGGSREEVEERMFDELFGADKAKAMALFNALSIDFEESGKSRSDFENEILRTGRSLFDLEGEE